MKADLIYLDIGKKSSKYYSHYAQIRDSVKVAGLNQKLSAYEVVENIRQFRDGIKTIVYSLPNSGMFYVADRLVDNYYYTTKRNIRFRNWALGQGKKTIADYVCKEAETDLQGQKMDSLLCTKYSGIARGVETLGAAEIDSLCNGFGTSF